MRHLSRRKEKKRQRDKQYDPRHDPNQMRLPFKDFIDIPSRPYWDVDDLPYSPRRRSSFFNSLSSFSPLSSKRAVLQNVHRIAFNDHRLRVCRSRRLRRSVLFATNRAGFGIRGPLRRFLTFDSFIHCRR